ncbi:hypothetical protein [Actinomadura sp. LOL_011]
MYEDAWTAQLVGAVERSDRTGPSRASDRFARVGEAPCPHG